MPDTNTGSENQIKYISLDNLTLYDQLIKSYINTGDAAAIKTVMLSTDGQSLEFYKESEPLSDGATAAYSIAIPQTNLDACMKKIVSALNGNVGIFNSSGQIVDGGVALRDLVTQTDVEALIAQAVAQTTHTSTVVVETLPTDADAKENVIYLILDPTASGADRYEEWMKISGVLTKIGDTSTDLQNYYTKTQVDDRVTAAKNDAITEAVRQAGEAADTKDAAILAAAEQYTDTSVSGLSDAIDTVETKADTNAANISTLQTTVSSNTDRIIILEQSSINIVTASDEEIRQLFS